MNMWAAISKKPKPKKFCEIWTCKSVFIVTFTHFYQENFATFHTNWCCVFQCSSLSAASYLQNSWWIDSTSWIIFLTKIFLDWLVYIFSDYWRCSQRYFEYWNNHQTGVICGDCEENFIWQIFPLWQAIETFLSQFRKQTLFWHYSDSCIENISTWISMIRGSFQLPKLF